MCLDKLELPCLGRLLNKKIRLPIYKVGVMKCQRGSLNFNGLVYFGMSFQKYYVKINFYIILFPAHLEKDDGLIVVFIFK